MMTIARRHFVMTTAAMLSGCGGGGPDPFPPPAPSAPAPVPVSSICRPLEAAAQAAVLGGTITTSNGVESALVFFGSASGQHTLVYGRDRQGAYEAEGMAQVFPWQCDYSDGRRVNAWDLRVGDMWLQADYDASRPSLAGAMLSATAGTLASFAGGTIPRSAYERAAPADLRSAAGSWSGATVPWAVREMSIQLDGRVSVDTASGYALAGQITAALDGTNVFDLVLDGAPLQWDNLRGQLITYPHADGSVRLVAWAVVYDVMGDYYPLVAMLHRE